MLRPVFFVSAVVFLVGFVLGWYGRACPECKPCAPVVQVEPVKVETQVAAPALDAQQKYTDREKTLNATIDQLRREAAAKPRTVTVTKAVPSSCKEYIPLQPVDCLDAADLELLRRAQRATASTP